MRVEVGGSWSSRWQDPRDRLRSYVVHDHERYDRQSFKALRLALVHSAFVLVAHNGRIRVVNGQMQDSTTRVVVAAGDYSYHASGDWGFWYGRIATTSSQDPPGISSILYSICLGIPASRTTVERATSTYKLATMGPLSSIDRLESHSDFSPLNVHYLMLGQWSPERLISAPTLSRIGFPSWESLDLEIEGESD